MMTSNLKIGICCTTTFHCFNLNPTTQAGFQRRYGQQVMTYCRRHIALNGYLKLCRSTLCGKIDLIPKISNMVMVLDGGTRFAKEELEIVMQLLH